MKIIFILLASMILTSCASNTIKSDEDYEKMIIGTWAEYVQDGEIKVYATYLPDGRYHTFGYFLPDFKQYFFADGLWKINDGVSCIEVTYINTNDYKPGDEICNHIASIDKTSFTFDSEGEKIKMLKVSENTL